MTEVHEIRIAYIGGGSRNWARHVMTDLALCEHLTGEIALYDIDHEAALAWQSKVNHAVNILFRHGANRGTEKMMVTLRGIDVGPPRRPNTPFPEEGVEALREDMAAQGLI